MGQRPDPRLAGILASRLVHAYIKDHAGGVGGSVLAMVSEHSPDLPLGPDDPRRAHRLPAGRVPPWRQPRGKSMVSLVNSPPESGGICGRLTYDLPLGCLQGGQVNPNGAEQRETKRDSVGGEAGRQDLPSVVVKPVRWQGGGARDARSRRRAEEGCRGRIHPEEGCRLQAGARRGAPRRELKAVSGHKGVPARDALQDAFQAWPARGEPLTLTRRPLTQNCKIPTLHPNLRPSTVNVEAGIARVGGEEGERVVSQEGCQGREGC